MQLLVSLKILSGQWGHLDRNYYLLFSFHARRTRRTEPRPGFPTGIPIVPVTPLKTLFEPKGKLSPELNRRFDWLGQSLSINHGVFLTLDRIKLELGKESSTGLTFVALSRVKASDRIMIVDRLDCSRVQKLGGKPPSIGLMIMHVEMSIHTKMCLLGWPPRLS